MFSIAIRHFLEQKSYNSLLPKAVFFDMDGVLFDSMPYHASAWVRAMNEIGIPFTVHEAYMNEGRTGHSTIDGAFNRTYGRNATEEEKQTIYKTKSQIFESFPPSTPMPYALEILNKLKAEGVDIYLVTGSGQPTLIDSLQLHFPGIFEKERMVTAFDVKHGKPHPEPYLMALKKSGCQPNEVVVVENAPLGVESATNAGLFCIALNTGPLDALVLKESGASVVLSSMQELFLQWDMFISQCSN